MKKSPKMKFVVISTIALASIVGIFVSAQSPTPSPSGQNLPVQIVMACVPVNKANLMSALQARPQDTYRIQYGSETAVGTLPAISPPPCLEGFVGNATQRATFKSTAELDAFLKAAGL
jgi:hypothetical protein